MSGRPYISDFGGQGIREAEDVLAGHAALAMQPPLVCRWPEGRLPEGFVVFCHGLGSNGSEYAALSRYWARHGYLVIHPTFRDAIGVVAREEPELGLDPEADLSRWSAMPEIRARMHEILHTPARWMERVAIVHAVMNALSAIFVGTCGRPKGTIPGAIAGHSFGAYTAQLLAGAEIDMPHDPATRFGDERFTAAMLLSAQGRHQQGLRDGSWDAMNDPVLTVTGTLDRGAKGGDWHWKSEPYEFAPPGGKYLAVLEDGDHFLGGLTERDAQSHVPAQQEAVGQITLAFLDAHLRDRRAARDWLESIDNEVGDCRLLFKRK
jgi:predicted dienelactone hydrolase